MTRLLASTALLLVVSVPGGPGALASVAAAAAAGPQTAARPRAAAVPGRTPLSETQALTLLSNAIERDAVYAPMARACMTFVVEVRAEAAFEIAVREKHGGRCGGDPATAPVLDRFRVDRATAAITVWDILEQDWYAWAEFKRHRDGLGQ
jgi:hypothetical protein